MTVDTLSLAKELRAAELSSTQAEAIAAAIGRAVIEGAATKADLAQVKTELKADIAGLKADIASLKIELEARIDAKIEQLKSTMLLWFIGTNITLAAVIIAAMKL